MDRRIFGEYPTSALRKHMLHAVLPVSYLSPDKRASDHLGIEGTGIVGPGPV